MKTYDRDYYRRWYQDPSTRVGYARSTLRKAALAVAAAEFILERPIRTVLDVGCGDGLWLAALKKLRRKVEYTGIDPSEYVVERLGRTHDIRLGTLGTLRRVKLDRAFDLVVCADVIQYVDDDELRRGLTDIRRLAGGVAYVEAFAAEDQMVGDRDGWHDRSERALRRFFRDAGLTHCGFYCWIDERKVPNANRFEIA
jgi:SAM-dependent methyltransferase